MVQNYVTVLLCCSSYIVWHWISHSAYLCLNFLLELEINFFIKTNKQPLLHFLNKSWPINPTTGELFSLIFSFPRFRSSALIAVGCVSAQMLPDKCIFKYWSNFRSSCTWTYFCRWAGTITAVSVAGAGLALHQGTSESWELGDRCLEISSCTKNPAGDWVKPLYVSVSGKSVQWWESCDVCPDNVLCPVFSLLWVWSVILDDCFWIQFKTIACPPSLSQRDGA